MKKAILALAITLAASTTSCKKDDTIHNGLNEGIIMNKSIQKGLVNNKQTYHFYLEKGYAKVDSLTYTEFEIGDYFSPKVDE